MASPCRGTPASTSANPCTCWCTISPRRYTRVRVLGRMPVSRYAAFTCASQAFRRSDEIPAVVVMGGLLEGGLPLRIHSGRTWPVRCRPTSGCASMAVMSRALSPSPEAHHPAPPLAPRTLGVGLILVVMIVAFESMAVGTVMPRVASDLNGLALFG